MAQQIIKQPDGNYAIWSSVVDDFIFTDATKDEILKHFGAEAYEYARKKALDTMDELDEGKTPYYQFTKSYAECLEILKKRKDVEEGEAR